MSNMIIPISFEDAEVLRKQAGRTGRSVSGLIQVILIDHISVQKEHNREKKVLRTRKKKVILIKKGDK